MRFLRFTFPLLILLCATLLAQSNPAPLVNQSLLPASVMPGGTSFTLAVSGTGFVSGAVAYWNGSPRTTTFVSSTTLQATILSTDIAKPGTATITVTNPVGGPSNGVYFPVRGSSRKVLLTATSNTVTVPGSVAVGDFNNDGRIDIAIGQVVDGGTGTIFIYLGRGNGTFLAPRQFASTASPERLVVGDFNGDGALDLAASDTTFSQTAIFLGSGTGLFVQKAKTVPGVLEGVGDFNGDGKLDMLLAENDGQNDWTSSYVGNGDGTFTLAQGSIGANVEDGARSVAGMLAIGDFNGDGKLDVAFPGAVTLGNGDGTFQSFLPTPSANGRAIATADLNGDGKLDLITDSVNVALGNGDGTFTSTTGVNLGGRFSFFSTFGDFNGDGKLDIALAPTDANGHNQELAILLGKGDGTFTTPIIFPASPNNYPIFGLAAGDFNHDGRLDLVMGSFTETYIFTQQHP